MTSNDVGQSDPVAELQFFEKHLPAVQALRQAAEAKRDETYAAAREALLKSPPVARAKREAQAAFRDDVTGYRRSEQSIRGNRNLSADGQKAEILAAKTAARALVAARRKAIDGENAILAATAERPGFKSEPRAEWRETSNLFWARAQYISPERIIAEAMELKAVADDPSADGFARTRAHYLLEQNYEPLLDRRGTSPERFAKPTQAIARELADALKAHLDVELGRTAYAATQELAAEIAGEFASVARTLDDPRYDEMVIALECPLLFSDATTE